MEYTVTIDNQKLVIKTEKTLFSPDAPDRGTLAMLSRAELAPGLKVLDLGCGCGLVGIYAAGIVGAENVVMSDSDERAVEIARENADENGANAARALVSDAYDGMDDRDFDRILVNPPYHTDFSVAKRFIEKGFNRLKVGGRLVMVTKRRDWYQNKLTAIFGGVKVAEADGYCVFTAEKRSTQYANAVKKEKKAHARG
ncbi:MAG: methyltransferase [Clostridiaceae bacterium]|nr:methyltransferase [Clostridiaceae bacterium]